MRAIEFNFYFEKKIKKYNSLKNAFTSLDWNYKFPIITIILASFALTFLARSLI